MKQTLLHERYPIFSLEIGKDETSFSSVEAIIAHLRQRIEAHRLASFIAVFDHFRHTKGLAEGQVDEQILAAQNIVFCFGLAIPSPQVMAVRPRSIGVVELPHSFVITFMEAPMPLANTAMEQWAQEIQDRRP
jgi:hypothetical protein